MKPRNKGRYRGPGYRVTRWVQAGKHMRFRLIYPRNKHREYKINDLLKEYSQQEEQHD